MEQQREADGRKKMCGSNGMVHISLWIVYWEFTTPTLRPNSSVHLNMVAAPNHHSSVIPLPIAILRTTCRLPLAMRISRDSTGQVRIIQGSVYLGQKTETLVQRRSWKKSDPRASSRVPFSPFSQGNGVLELRQTARELSRRSLNTSGTFRPFESFKHCLISSQFFVRQMPITSG